MIIPYIYIYVCILYDYIDLDLQYQSTYKVGSESSTFLFAQQTLSHLVLGHGTQPGHTKRWNGSNDFILRMYVDVSSFWPNGLFNKSLGPELGGTS